VKLGLRSCSNCRRSTSRTKRTLAATSPMGEHPPIDCTAQRERSAVHRPMAERDGCANYEHSLDPPLLEGPELVPFPRNGSILSSFEFEKWIAARARRPPRRGRGEIPGAMASRLIPTMAGQEAANAVWRLTWCCAERCYDQIVEAPKPTAGWSRSAHIGRRLGGQGDFRRPVPSATRQLFTCKPLRRVNAAVTGRIIELTASKQNGAGRYEAQRPKTGKLSRRTEKRAMPKGIAR
jgi:hypothetical protein